MQVTNLFFGLNSIYHYIKSFFGQKLGATPNYFELLRPCYEVLLWHRILCILGIGGQVDAQR